MWRETTIHERNEKIWNEELESFVPEKVLDFHVHVFCQGVVPANKTYCCAGQEIIKYDYNDLRRDLAECYPERETFAVCFGLPDVEFDKRLNDEYVAANADHLHFFPLRLFDPFEHDAAALKRQIIEKRFLGIKPYLNYVRKENPAEVEIPEMLPDWMMEIIDELGLLVMLHIPRKERLADPLNQRHIVELCRKYPKATIILAHVGRAYYLKNIIGFLDAFKDIPNLYYDLAMLNNSEVLEYLFQNAPSHKILYATDTPIAIAPGKSVEINNQYTYITPRPWKLSISDEHEKIIFTSFLFEELRAIKKAVHRCGLDRASVRRIFYDNGIELLAQAGANRT